MIFAMFLMLVVVGKEWKMDGCNEGCGTSGPTQQYFNVGMDLLYQASIKYTHIPADITDTSGFLVLPDARRR